MYEVLRSGLHLVRETLGRLQKHTSTSRPISGQLSENLLGSGAQLAFLKHSPGWFYVQAG